MATKTETAQDNESRPLEAAALRMGSAARSGAQAEAEVLRESGETFRRTLQEGARATQGSIDAGGQAAWRGMETAGEATQDLIEVGADQFERIGAMMADAARDASHNARMLTVFSTVTNDGIRGMQQAASGLLERIIQINVAAMQELMQQANVGGVTALQQRFLRQYLEAMAECSTDLLGATQDLAKQTIRPLEEQARAAKEAQRERAQREGGRIADVMSRKVRAVHPDDTVQQAAKLMGDEDTGVLPVTDDSRVIGMLTDRDLAIRLVGAAKDPAKTKVRDVMSQEVQYCYEDEDLEHVAHLMAEQQLHRLPVMDRRQNLVGIVSVGDMAERRSPDMAGQTLAGIARSSRQHSQRVPSRRARK